MPYMKTKFQLIWFSKSVKDSNGTTELVDHMLETDSELTAKATVAALEHFGYEVGVLRTVEIGTMGCVKDSNGLWRDNLRTRTH